MKQLGFLLLSFASPLYAVKLSLVNKLDPLKKPRPYATIKIAQGHECMTRLETIDAGKSKVDKHAITTDTYYDFLKKKECGVTKITVEINGYDEPITFDANDLIKAGMSNKTGLDGKGDLNGAFTITITTLDIEKAERDNKPVEKTSRGNKPFVNLS